MSLVLGLGLLACDADEVGPATPRLVDEGVRRVLPVLPDGHVPLGPTEPVPGEGVDDESRQARRIAVAALERSIPRLFGGVTWTIEMAVRGGEAREYPLFEVLGRTLGKPDYVEVTEENTDPSPLFAKFMDDMAGDVCRKAVDRDGAGGPEGLVIRHPEDPDANLRFLRLKLHSIHVPPDVDEGIVALKTLYNGLKSDTGSSPEAWYGVCVAMLTAPEFMGY